MTGGDTSGGPRGDNDFEDKAELDDLIAVLKSGEYFDRRRGRRASGISVTSSTTTTTGGNSRNSRVLEFSRERSNSSLSGTAESAVTPSTTTHRDS